MSNMGNDDNYPVAVYLFDYGSNEIVWAGEPLREYASLPDWESDESVPYLRADKVIEALRYFETLHNDDVDLVVELLGLEPFARLGDAFRRAMSECVSEEDS